MKTVINRIRIQERNECKACLVESNSHSGVDVVVIISPSHIREDLSTCLLMEVTRLLIVSLPPTFLTSRNENKTMARHDDKSIASNY